MNFKTESNRIFCENDEKKVVAEITFPEVESGVFCINHTFTDTALRGQGIADKLIKLAVEKIKSQNGKITATCSYAQHWLKKNNI